MPAAKKGRVRERTSFFRQLVSYIFENKRLHANTDVPICTLSHPGCNMIASTSLRRYDSK